MHFHRIFKEFSYVSLHRVDNGDFIPTEERTVSQ